MDTTETIITPIKQERDENGLIKGVNYIFKDGGRRVDWLAMIPKEYFVPNRQSFEKRKQPVPTSVEGLDHKDLLILLAGFREVAALRGFEYVSIPTVSTTESRTTSVCEIRWIPNFETGMTDSVIYSGSGDATLQSTRDFGFLGPISENRAFIRCVRNFLRIPVLGKDELDNNKKEIDAENNDDSNKKPNHISVLENLMKAKKISFDAIKKKLIDENKEYMENCFSVDEIEHEDVISLIERLGKIQSPSKK